MQIYLPIAELSVNAFLLLGLGGIVGVLSGMFGVGGGFLITPLLFFIGIPPAVAVATGANQIVASSFSALLVHLKRKTVDLRMGSVLLAAGVVSIQFVEFHPQYGSLQFIQATVPSFNTTDKTLFPAILSK